MIKLFFDKIRDAFPAALDRMAGYSEAEIGKIEKLYGIVISGDFASFMLRAGRSDGGLIGDDPFILYRSSWDVRTHILFQVNFLNSLQEIGAWDFLKKPFVFSLEAETQYYFLQTGLQGASHVYHYDENNKAVRNTGMTFSDYLLDVLGRYPAGGVICQGELLI